MFRSHPCVIFFFKHVKEEKINKFLKNSPLFYICLFIELSLKILVPCIVVIFVGTFGIGATVPHFNKYT